MSQENIDLVRKVIPPTGTDYTELFRDDVAWVGLKDSVDSLVDPDFEGAFVAEGQPLLEFAGLDGLREAWIQWLAPWSRYYDDFEAVLPVGADRVVLLGREHGYRLDTESEVTAAVAGVYFVRNGKIARADYYANQAEALEAVGLQEYAMSRRNIAVTHQTFDAFIRRDLDAFVALHDPDCRIQPLFAALDDTYLGHDGVRKYWDDLVGAFSDTNIQVIEVRELGNRTLTALEVGYSVPPALDPPQRRSEAAIRSAPGTDSADVIAQVNWILAEIRNGRILWWRTFRTEAEALEAAGLRE